MWNFRVIKNKGRYYIAETYYEDDTGKPSAYCITDDFKNGFSKYGIEDIESMLGHGLSIQNILTLSEQERLVYPDTPEYKMVDEMYDKLLAEMRGINPNESDPKDIKRILYRIKWMRLALSYTPSEVEKELAEYLEDYEHECNLKGVSVDE